jgi:hypothetical protein
MPPTWSPPPSLDHIIYMNELNQKDFQNSTKFLLRPFHQTVGMQQSGFNTHPFTQQFKA